MGFFDNLVKSIFGNKSDRDYKEMQPVVQQINAEYEKLKSLSHDQLRAKTAEFKARIAEHLNDIDAEINGLKAQAEAEEDLVEKDNLYKKADDLRKDRDKKIEEVLNEILPEAFAVVKETAFRFTNNEFIESTATDLDRELAVRFGNITIEGDKVRHANSWMAAGVPVKWEMVHYDVQLIGGMVLHQGKDCGDGDR
jgi:preprotein translocase subunit SecA